MSAKKRQNTSPRCLCISMAAPIIACVNWLSCQISLFDLCASVFDFFETLAHRPDSYFIKEIIRPKYAAPKNPDAGKVTANLPESLLKKCFGDESLLADILLCVTKNHSFWQGASFAL